MSASAHYKVYSADKEFRGACKYAEDAAALAFFTGEGSTVRGRDHRKILWTCGPNGDVSYDEAAATIHANES